MFRFLAAGACLFAMTAIANAQNTQARVVTSCGSQSLNAGTQSPLTVDVTGTLCAGGSSSSGGEVVQGPGTPNAPSGGVLSVQTPSLITTGTITTYNQNPTGAATAGSAVTYNFNSLTTTAITVSGTWSGSTLSLQFLGDCTNSAWITKTSNTGLFRRSNGAYSATIPAGANDTFMLDDSGYCQMRVTALGAGFTGTANINIVQTSGNEQPRIGQPTLGTGTNAIGYAGGFNNGPISVTPTVTASAYTANNAIGGLQTVAVFRNTTRPTGLLDYVSVASKGGMTTSMALYAFTKSPASTCTDKSAFVLSSTDLPYLVPGFPITITPAVTVGTTQSTAAQSIAVSVNNQDSSATTNLYFCAVTTGTPTPASTSDLIFNYALVQD